MAELTEHRRSIMQAVLLGLKIEYKDKLHADRAWRPLEPESILWALAHVTDDALRIAPGQDEKVVRLYGIAEDGRFWDSSCVAGDETHYFDYNPTTGAIVGGKL